MSLYVCSLLMDGTLAVPVAGDDYYLVRFPYGAAESWDPHNMHTSVQPRSVTSVYPDQRSGLIWPTCSGWATLTAIVFWEPGTSSEYRARFVRDPLNLTTGYDSTATTDEAPTPGGQYKHYSHQMFVHPNTPVGFMVKHAASSPLDITLAEFKMAIDPDVAVMPDQPPLLPGKLFP